MKAKLTLEQDDEDDFGPRAESDDSDDYDGVPRTEEVPMITTTEIKSQDEDKMDVTLEKNENSVDHGLPQTQIVEEHTLDVRLRTGGPAKSSIQIRKKS